MTNSEYELILKECKEAVIKTKKEVEEFIIKYPDTKNFLENLTLCWVEEF